MAIGIHGAKVWESLAEEASICSPSTLTRCNQQILRTDLRNLATLLHSRKCKERLLAKRQSLQLYKTHPWRFYKSLGPPRTHLDLSTLSTPRGLLTSPAAIHDELCSYFQQLFAHKACMDNIWDNSVDCDVFCAQTNLLVPLKLRQQLWAALRSPTSSLRDSVAMALSPDRIVVTLAEFRMQLAAASNKSAGGPSGLTYSMLKHIPDDLLVSIHELLDICWNKGDLPPWWKEKLLYPLAKKIINRRAGQYPADRAPRRPP